MRISISRVTLCTSASSVIFRFSKIFTATYRFKTKLSKVRILCIFEITYFFVSNVMSTELDFSKCSFANILSNDIVTD